MVRRLEGSGVSNGDVFSDIAGRYDRLNAILSLGRDQAWRKRAVEQLPRGRVLDLGAGTGAANEIFGGSEVVALDPSPQMLALNDADHRVVGVGEGLPFKDGAFDAVLSAYVFRNLESVEATLAEIHRVLRPGGVLSFFEYVAIRRARALVSGPAERVRLRGIAKVLGGLLDS
ncbi:MAG: methyltransferase domain-containing protein, partial [Acidobacteria bacterium]|nr:methyltransferase domain-containing protein [Acidobacteriota bacterium]